MSADAILLNKRGMEDTQTAYDEPVFRLEQYCIGSALTVAVEESKPRRTSSRLSILIRRPISNLVAMNGELMPMSLREL